MNIRAISSLEHNYNLKATNKVNITTPIMKNDIVEITSNTLSFKGVDKKRMQGYRKLAKSHAKVANRILKDSNPQHVSMESHLGMRNLIKLGAETYHTMALRNYEYAKDLFDDAQGQVCEDKTCGNLTFYDGTQGSYICFEQDGVQGLTLIKQNTVVTKFGEKLTITIKEREGFDRIYTFGKDGELQKFEQYVNGPDSLFENIDILYADGEMTEYRIRDIEFSNHYEKKYVCEDGKITKVYGSCYEDMKGVFHAGSVYSFEDENKPVLLTGYHTYPNGSSVATDEYTFIKVDDNSGCDAYKLDEFKFRMSKNPEGKVEASKIYKYQNDKLASMSIGQFVSQNGQEVAREHYVCDANGKPQEVLLNTKFDENSGEVVCCDEQISLSLSSKIAEIIEDFKMSW